MMFIYNINFYYQDNEKKAIQVLDKMSDYYKKMKSFSSTFKYAMINLEEDIEDSFEGKIVVKDEKYVLKIEGQEIINDGKTIWTYLPELNEVNISLFEPENQEISLNNIFEIYKSGFNLNYLEEGDSRYHTVELYPQDDSKTYYKIRILINKTDISMYNFSVFDRHNTIYIYTIDEFKEEKYGDDFFSFDLTKYPDIEVVDFR